MPHNPNVFTVTVSGSERHDGEAPYTYVVRAATIEDAMDEARAYHRDEYGDDDLVPHWDLSFQGEPDTDADYGWTDLRNRGGQVTCRECGIGVYTVTDLSFTRFACTRCADPATADDLARPGARLVRGPAGLVLRERL